MHGGEQGDAHRSELERLASLTGEAVEERLETSLRAYWLDRVAQHTRDSYAGIPFSKFPEDLRVYEHLLWASRPDVVIELGTQYGASALWFRDRLRTLASYGLVSHCRVITVDLETGPARGHLDEVDPRWSENISLLQGDVADGELAARVERLVPPGSRCFVVEDSAHTYATTKAALEGFARFVGPGGFYVVEDGCVDVEAMRLDDAWPRGVLPALRDWLEGGGGRGFAVRRDLELYGITCHPGGMLQRRIESAA